MDFNTLRAVFFLITIMAVFFAATSAALSIFGFIIRHLVRWLLRIKFVADFVDYIRQYLLIQKNRIQQRIQTWDSKYRRFILSLWDVYSEIFLDPAFYAFALYFLVKRIESFSDYTKTDPQTSLWGLLNLDFQSDTTFYTLFMAVFFAWAYWKMWRRSEEMRNQRALEKSLVGIEKALSELPKTLDVMVVKLEELPKGFNVISTRLDEMPKKIRLEMERKDDKPDSEQFHSVL